MKTMSAAAGLEGKRFVNHSGRKTVIETLLHAGIDCLQTARLTGHKNPKCLDDYASASFAQQKEMSMLVNAKHNANGTSHSTNQLQLQHSDANSRQSEGEASDENPSAISSFTDGLFANSTFANSNLNSALTKIEEFPYNC